MTPAPNETFTEYNDIFKNYVEFSDLGVDVITYTDEIKLKDVVCGDKNKHCIIIISKQKLGWTEPKGTGDNLKNSEFKTDDDEDHHEYEDHHDDEGDKKNEGKEVDNIKKSIKRIKKLIGEKNYIDIIFLDEAHFGMSTDKAMRIVEILDDTIKGTIKVFVTATYNKPLNVYGIKPECKITWDMNDIKIMQNLNKETINDNNIRQRFGIKNYTETLKYFGDENGTNIMEKLKKEYSVYPKPFLITSMWDKEFLNAEKLKIGDSEFGWDMSKLFATDGGTFVNNEQIKELMRYYFGYPDKTENYNKQAFYRTRGIIPRIKNICVNKCRTLQNRHKTSQLWFLPIGNGDIRDKAKAIIALLTQSNEFKDIKDSYHFFIAIEIVSKKGATTDNITYMGEPHNIKSDIESCEKKIKEGKLKGDNLIIIAGNRLQLGISLRNVDIVTLWNSTTSADALFQMLFRSMTEVDSKPCDGTDYCQNKKFGFMVDMNPQRALTNVNLFSDNITNQDNDEHDTKKWKQITDLINIDEDVFQDKYEGDESKKDEFVTELFNKLYASWDINVDNIKRIIQGFSFNEDVLNDLKSKYDNVEIEKNKMENKTISGDNPDDIFTTGKTQEIIQGPNKTKELELKADLKKNKKNKEVNIRDKVIETLSEVISLLNIFTLYEDGSSGCVLTTPPVQEQATIISDIVTLKNKVFEDNIQKEIFMTILNGRLTGGKEPFSEDLLNSTLNAVNKTGDKQAINKIVLSQKKKYYTINEPDQLLEFINENLKPKEKEKKENGEVFTPLSLVSEMLDKLDESYEKEHKKSIFTDGSLKWFDPAGGIGNFPIIVYMRLMIGLKSSFGDEEKRRKHILENMLYMSELNPKNILISKKIFCSNSYKLNIYQGDSLKLNARDFWKLDNFDVVMGNPPYNSGGTKTSGEKNIYVLFSIMGLDLLKKGGYLVYIHPPTYRISEHLIKHVNTDLNDIYTKKQIKFIRMFSIMQTKKIMDVMINVDYVIVKNDDNDHKTKTKIIDTMQNEYNILILPNRFIPNYGINIMSKLYEMAKKNGSLNLISTSEMHTQFIKYDNNSKYKNIHGIISSGIKICRTNNIHSLQSKRKLIINGIGSYNYVLYDKTGTYGVTQTPKSIIEPNKNAVKLIQSKLFHYITESTKIIGNNLIVKTSLFLPFISDEIKIEDDTDLYKYFNFSESEIKEIEKTQIPIYKNIELTCDGRDLTNKNGGTLKKKNSISKIKTNKNKLFGIRKTNKKNMKNIRTRKTKKND